jgi:4a-hydroxytetrahydrobiopterin dehydratase
MSAGRVEEAVRGVRPAGGDTMATLLSEKTCTPCRGGVPPLAPEEAEGYRAREAPDWSLMDGVTRIERRFRFKDFREAFAFVARAAELAEAEGHHPDITFGWGYAVVSLRTKKIGGLHENDFIMAAKLDRLADGGPAPAAARPRPRHEG